MAIVYNPDNILPNTNFVDKITLFTKIDVYNSKSTTHIFYYKYDNNLYLPFGLQNLGKFETYDYPSIDLTFSEKLYSIKSDPKHKRDQKTLVKNTLTILKKDGMCFLSLYTGYGKTRCAIYISVKLKLKIGIICHSIIVREQWKKTFEKLTRAVVQMVSKQIDNYADVYIFGPLVLKKFSPSDLSHIGIVIVDEAHIATPSIFTQILKFSPKYLIGLSATPKRVDGLHSIFKLFFNDNFITILEKKEFSVIKYKTKFKPDISYTIINGKVILNWSKVINSLAYSEERNLLIFNLVVNILEKNPSSKILILCDRTSQAKSIFYHTTQNKIDSFLLIEDNTYNIENKVDVLIATTKKAGVGFDDPTRNVLLIASDSKNIIQYEGRIRCDNNTIYHIVDDYSTLEKHWKLCESWYLQKGATIINEGVTFLPQLFVNKNSCVPLTNLLLNK